VHACEVLGLNLIQKCTSLLHMFAYDQVANACDEYYRIGEITSHECLECLVRMIKGVFELKFLM
jgi:hypothetical protein